MKPYCARMCAVPFPQSPQPSPQPPQRIRRTTTRARPALCAALYSGPLPNQCAIRPEPSMSFRVLCSKQDRDGAPGAAGAGRELWGAGAGGCFGCRSHGWRGRSEVRTEPSTKPNVHTWSTITFSDSKKTEI
eukprot:4615536-Prymnesium_polylepis.2